MTAARTHSLTHGQAIFQLQRCCRGITVVDLHTKGFSDPEAPKADHFLRGMMTPLPGICSDRYKYLVQRMCCFTRRRRALSPQIHPRKFCSHKHAVPIRVARFVVSNYSDTVDDMILGRLTVLQSKKICNSIIDLASTRLKHDVIIYVQRISN